nr:serine/threonine-protein kinase [Rhodopirellula sp. SM50]
MSVRPPEPHAHAFPEFPGYSVVGLLGRGGMGAVYDAVHHRFNRPVAIKILTNVNPQVLKRFQREMAAIGQLSHHNIVCAFSATEHNGTQFLVMERVNGLTLSEIAARCGKLRIADACEMIRQAACGLQHAHEHGLVHRDIKPSNMMVDVDGVVKLLDLGLARLSADEQASRYELTATGQIMGTIDYMAPEQASGKPDVGMTADIYSLGASLYRLLAGHVPFHGDRYQAILAKLNAVVNEVPPPLRAVREDLPGELDSIIARMLDKDPQARFQQPHEVVEALSPFCDGADLPALGRLAMGADAPTTALAETSPALTDAISTLSMPSIPDDPIGSMPKPRKQGFFAICFACAIVGSAVVYSILTVLERNRAADLDAIQRIPQPRPIDVLTSTDWTWSEPEPVIVENFEQVLTPSLTDDELTLVFVNDFRLWIAKRTSIEKPFGEASEIALPVNPRRCESSAISGDGLCVVVSLWTKPAPDDDSNLWIFQRDSVEASFGKGELIKTLQFPHRQIGAWLNSDATRLVFCSSHNTNGFGLETWVAERSSITDGFHLVGPLAASVTEARETEPALSSDGLVTITALFIPGKQIYRRLAMRVRRSTLVPFGEPIPLEIQQYHSGSTTSAHLSRDATRLYYSASTTPTDVISQFHMTRRQRRLEEPETDIPTEEQSATAEQSATKEQAAEVRNSIHVLTRRSPRGRTLASGAFRILSQPLVERLFPRVCDLFHERPEFPFSVAQCRALTPLERAAAGVKMPWQRFFPPMPDPHRT